MSDLDEALAVRETISRLGFDIYHSLKDHPHAVYTARQLEALLRHELIGLSFDAPNRTRGKLIKQAVAGALGYPVPVRLRKTKPRFPGQDLDVHTQQRNNLQIWNDEVSATRRYVIAGLDAHCAIVAIRVIEGTDLAPLDRTGTLTSKYQAKRRSGRSGSLITHPSDTTVFVDVMRPVDDLPRSYLRRQRATDAPRPGHVLTISAVHEKLMSLVGCRFAFSSSERRRGERLHQAVCQALNIGTYADSGHFPDIAIQALEVKLQLSTTIDLGLVCPDSTEQAITLFPGLRYCDTRYFVAYGVRNGNTFQITHVVTTTGSRFFDEFRRFEGRVRNSKLQLRLPSDFFEAKQLPHSEIER